MTHHSPGAGGSVRVYGQLLLGSPAGSEAEKLNHPKATCILDFAPGEAAQVDFGKGPDHHRCLHRRSTFKTWIFVMTLCFSRHLYAEIVTNQKVETWLACHRRAFEFFNGVPAKLIIDNPKCAITRACFRDPEVQRSYGELAEGYGFLISPCPPRDPEKKGRVEAGVKYVKNRFVPLRQFRSLADANAQLQQWVMETAGNRIHGTTRQKPLTLFAESEKHLLQAPARCAGGDRRLGQGQASRQLPCPVREGLLLGAVSP